MHPRRCCAVSASPSAGERDATRYVSRIWEELDYAHRHPLTACIDREVRNVMEKLIAAIGRKDSRFSCKFVQLGSSLEGTKLCDPDEFDYNIELLDVADICISVRAVRRNID